MTPVVLSPTGALIAALALGFGFGFVLERAGFGDARRLAAQFYLHEMRVLKVMFGAIVVAMLLLYWSAALGRLELERLWVNPTHLWPGVVGGLVLGMGFIIGGYCPGTSLVSAATLKLDGVFFLLGVLVGTFAFGEAVAWRGLRAFWEAEGQGRVLTLDGLLEVDPGWVVLAVVGMALAMFRGAEWLEPRFARLRARSGLS